VLDDQGFVVELAIAVEIDANLKFVLYPRHNNAR
jgi:hypothetical protein